MKREELEAMGLEKEQIDQILAINGKDITREQAKATKTATELEEAQASVQRLKELEKELDEQKKQTMTADEQLAEATKRAEEVKKEFQLKINRLSIEKKLSDNGVNADTYEGYDSLLTQLVTDDIKHSETLADGIISLLKVQTEKAINEAKNRDLDDISKTPTGAGSAEPESVAAEMAKKFSGSGFNVI